MKLDGVVKRPIDDGAIGNSLAGAFKRPSEQLFIYYLEGTPQSPLELGSDFIGNWQEGDSAFLFFQKPAPMIVDQLVRSQSNLVLIDHYQMSYAEWQGDTVDGFRVEELYVRPPWIVPESKARREIVLDPGVVFGNGNHTTTHDCLTALQQVYQEGCPKRVLDLGCGTGILALAAAHLGAEKVLAVDLNRLAVDVTRRNVLYNEFKRQILAVHASAETMLDYPTDLLIANIHSAVMRQLIRQPSFRKHCHMILSGLLRSELKAVESELAAGNIDCIQHWSHDGIWHTILCKPKKVALGSVNNEINGNDHKRQ